ncbi:hypothetical protein [Halosimplex salinum]|nr:hypothetical protein [Halosimplex salinum]
MEAAGATFASDHCFRWNVDREEWGLGFGWKRDPDPGADIRHWNVGAGR